MYRISPGNNLDREEKKYNNEWQGFADAKKQIGKKILEVDRLWISDLKKEKY